MGKWTIVDPSHHGSEVLAVHAALLGDGQVVFFSGSEHDRDQHIAGDFDHSRVWDPVAGTVRPIPSPNYDLFCCGHAFLADGPILVAGGTKAYEPGYLGARQVTIFDPQALAAHHDPWVPAPPMAAGRWYPTLVTLPDGRVLCVAGSLDEPFPPPPNPLVEVFVPGAQGGAWHQAGQRPDMPAAGYPRMHLVPDGRVLSATAMGGRTRSWDPVSEQWADVAPGPGPEYDGFNTTSVLLPLLPSERYRARVLVAGAEEPRLLDFEGLDLGWQPAGHRALPGSPRRNHACAVLLPDATVLVVGGTTSELDADAVKVAERFDPATGQWSALEAASVPRVYHNVALLLPDGTVWTAGSNHDAAQGHSEHRMEVYHPSYVDHPHRPAVIAAPATLRVPSGLPARATFEVETPDAVAVDAVALLRCGSITHAFDADQRYVGLEIVGRAADRLTVAAPPLTEIAPPGRYFLYLVADGVPSVGHPLHVQPVAWSESRPLPGGVGWETAGADVALADISGSGRLDLVAFHVDNPAGDNHGYYRIGWDLDPAGHPAGGWSPHVAVPGWFGWETAGAGVAVADISGSGRPDLLVLHVDNPGGDNHGYYRIGWDLDATGNPAGGWTPPLAVPGGFGWETAEAGVAIADISGSGRPDLVVFHVDNPGGDNQGYYRIGWDLDPAGVANGGWSEHKPAPGGVGWETAGAGVAVADISGSGRPDLVLLHVDNPEGDNHAYYRIGWDLDHVGNPTAGWTHHVGIPGGVGWQTSGAGVAAGDISGNGQVDLAVLWIDDPEGDNRAFYRVLLR
ncbi:MAG TPA: galactose oxidase-like domain-containing protein [Acidimicrobiales bacterium]|nr:galactose oxidase-like domain-containing protein [Acidimicrobiales bacterium]